MAGIYTDVSSVKTLLNCSFRMVALVFGSLCAIPCFQRGYATAVTVFAFDECIELLGVFVTCHDVADVTVISLFTLIFGFLLKLHVPLEFTV